MIYASLLPYAVQLLSGSFSLCCWGLDKLSLRSLN
jgi:hypothetical protein